jgi:DNA (cytosine-5)-methyltransferase 1
VAQRRRRVFVVGYLGDWRVAAAVLFERESLQGNTKTSRKKREEVASNVEGSVGESGDVSCVGGNISPTVTSKWKTGYGGPSGSNETGNMVYAPTVIDRAAFNQEENAQYEPRIEAGETMSSLVAKGPHAVAQPLYYESHPQDSRVKGPKDVADTVSANYGMGGGNTPLVQQPFRKVRRAQSDSDFETWEKDETANTINCFDVGDVRSTNVVAQPISIDAECNARTNQFGTLVRGGEGGTQQFVAQPIAFEPGKMQRLGYGYSDNGTSPTLRSEPGDNQLAVAQPLYYESHPNDSRVNGPKDVADTVSARYGTGGGNTPLVQQPIAVDTYNYTTNDHTTQTIRSQSDTEHIGAVLQPIAVDVYNQSIDGQTSATITEAVGGTNTSGPKVMHSMAIRRLTPKECERLQGFPDDWTKIPYRNKPADQCPDGPRYKACGNSMAVPVMRWIGQRIQYVENLMKEL